MKKQDGSDSSVKENISSYFKGVKLEWGKITWPEKKQVIAQTIMVLGVVIFFTVLVYLLDVIFGFGFREIPKLFGITY
jgi:preprotein translocase subunit SecE